MRRHVGGGKTMLADHVPSVGGPRRTRNVAPCISRSERMRIRRIPSPPADANVGGELPVS
jgi:hypothetical protein